jgi:hypothetical protein
MFWLAVKPEGASAWLVRRGALNLLIPYAAYHTLALAPSGSSSLEDLQALVEGRLTDSAVEVAEVAATALQSALMTQSEAAQGKASERFLQQLVQAKLPKRVPPPAADPGSPAGAAEAEAYKAYKAKLSAAVRKRLGALLAVGAVIKAHPFDVPSLLPPALAALARAANDASPMGPTVQKIIAEFRLTHQDMWTQHKVAFTEDQLADIGSVGTGNSYFC